MSQGPSPTYPRAGQRCRRSLFGPLFLILVGMLFLLRNIGVISHAAFSEMFWRWWPLLLILWGVTRLVDWHLARKAGMDMPRFPAGGVVLLIFLIFFGLGSWAVRNADWSHIDGNDDWDYVFTHFGPAHEFQESAQQQFVPGSLVKISTMQGNIEVSPSQDGIIHVAARNVVYASEDEATKLENESKPAITREGEAFIVRGSNNKHVRANLRVELPAKATLELNTDYGKISVSGIQGDVQAYTGHGNIKLEDLGGDAHIDMRGQLAEVRRVHGAVAVTGRVEDLDVSDAAAVAMDGEYLGSMTVERIGKSVRFHSPNSDMEIAGVRGRLFIGGNVEGNDIAGPTRIHTDAKNVRLEDFAGDMSIEDSTGNISLRPRALGAISVLDHNGSIRLDVPKDANFSLSAQTRDGGDIESDFPNLQPQSSGNATRVSGRIGSGGTSVTLDTDKASIEIRKTTTIAAKSKSPSQNQNEDSTDKDSTDNDE